MATSIQVSERERVGFESERLEYERARLLADREEREADSEAPQSSGHLRSPRLRASGVGLNCSQRRGEVDNGCKTKKEPVYLLG